MRLIRRVRQNDQRAFSRWLRTVNMHRTRMVGLVLLAFAVFWSAATATGYIDDSPLLFTGFLIGLVVGLILIHLGRHREIDRVTEWGEWTVLAVAILWMFAAVIAQVTNGHGLVEFVIGTLALAMLRIMTPITAAVAFSALISSYIVVLAQQNLLAFYPVNNGILFCLFALILSVANYNSTVLAFRNHQLVQQLSRQNQQLKTLAMQDSLTGLPNRRYFDQLLDSFCHDNEAKEQSINLILLDIDNFKAYNDHHGHPAGDQCLREVADILTTVLRREATCCRLGGEEFGVLLRGMSPHDTRAMAERLRAQIAQDSDITLSLGVAVTRPGAMSVGDFYRHADRALYKAKRQGRNCVVEAAPRLNAQASAEADAEASAKTNAPEIPFRKQRPS